MNIEIVDEGAAPAQTGTWLVPLRRENLAEALGRIAAAAGVDADGLRRDFHAYRQTWRFLGPAGTGAARLALLGIGADAACDPLRQSVRRFVSEERSILGAQLAIDLADWSNLADREAETTRRRVAACVQGCALGSTDLGRFKTAAAVGGAKERDSAGKRIDRLLLRVPAGLAAVAREAARRSLIVVQAQLAAMQLVDAPSNRLTPEDLAQAATDAGRRSGFAVHVLGRPEIEREGMGGLLAVNRGSSLPPTFSVLDYNPEPDANRVPAVGLAGKGVTFDTGGISLKGSDHLSNMKCDMAGAAAVIGAVEAAARLRLPLRVVGVVPATDNKPDASAQNPGDVISTMAGITVEVEDTDAEGRLILADALAYLTRFKPDVLIDLATLTGAIYVALGDHAAGLFSNHDELARQLEDAGRNSDERVWRMPLWPDYDRQIESDVADLKNYGGRPAGAVTAARFLQRFIGDHPRWAHLDVAGVAFSESEFARHRHATGFGVRLLTEFLEIRSAKV